MKIDDIYPGKLVNDLRIIEKVRRDKNGQLKLRESTNSRQIYYLTQAYYHENVHLKEKDMVLSGPFVVLNQQRDGYMVASVNPSIRYVDRLVELIYPEKGIELEVQAVPWAAYWKHIYNDNKDSGNRQLEISDSKKKDWLELKMPWAVLPVYSDPRMKCIEAPDSFYPNVLLSRVLTNVYSSTVYRSDTEISWPLMYSAKLIEDGLSDATQVRIYLHGFIDPLKLHYHLWKHVTDDPRIIKKEHLCSLERWNEYTGRVIPGTLKNVIFNKCTPPKRDYTCNNDCPEKRFTKVHRQIKTYHNEYLKQFVTFFEKNPTIDNRVKLFNSGKAQPGHFQKFGDLEFYEVVDCKSKPTPSVIRTFLDGYCYNWKVPGEEPIIHFYCRSFYIGPNDGKRFQAYSELKKPSGTSVKVGTFSDIKRVK